MAGRIDASPHWADGFWWWHIQYRSGVRGWSADAEPDVIYLVIDDDPSAPEAIAPPPSPAPPTPPSTVRPPTPSGSPSTSPSGTASLTVVVIPSLMSALSIARHDLHVVMEGPARYHQTIPSVAPAFPVTVVFDAITPGTYVVTAHHGSSRLQRTIEVRGQTLQVDFVMP